MESTPTLSSTSSTTTSPARPRKRTAAVAALDAIQRADPVKRVRRTRAAPAATTGFAVACWAVATVREDLREKDTQEANHAVEKVSVWSTLQQALEYRASEDRRRLLHPRKRVLQSMLLGCALPAGARFSQGQEDTCLVCDLASREFVMGGSDVPARHGLIVQKVNVEATYERLCSLAHREFCDDLNHYDRMEACLLKKGHQFVIEPATLCADITSGTLDSSSQDSSSHAD